MIRNSSASNIVITVFGVHSSGRIYCVPVWYVLVSPQETEGARETSPLVPLSPATHRSKGTDADLAPSESHSPSSPTRPPESQVPHTHMDARTQKSVIMKKKMLSGCSYVCVVIICSLRCAKASQPRHHVHSTASTCLFLMACCCNFCWRIPKVSDALSLEYIYIHTHTLV